MFHLLFTVKSLNRPKQTILPIFGPILNKLDELVSKEMRSLSPIKSWTKNPNWRSVNRNATTIVAAFIGCKLSYKSSVSLQTPFVSIFHTHLSNQRDSHWKGIYGEWLEACLLPPFVATFNIKHHHIFWQQQKPIPGDNMEEGDVFHKNTIITILQP